MKIWRLAAASLVLAVGVAACDEAPTGIQPEPQEAVARVVPPLPASFGLDAHYARLAEEVPGFGGAYYDGGRLVVHMARRKLVAEAPMIRQDLRTRLSAEAPWVSGGGALAPVSGTEIELREAAFDYAQLVDWHGRAGAALGVAGAVFTDIDERTNRLRIGVEAGADQSAFRRALEAQGVPAEAVTFTESVPIRPLKGMALTDRVQPLAGGLQLVFPNPIPGFVSLCTLGFNVDGPEPGRAINYFITNSHCTLSQGALDGTPYHQQPIAPLNSRYLIAREVQDPPYFDCGSGFVCRFSDASMARYERLRTPVEHQSIYRPESVNAGSTVIDEDDPVFTITGGASFPLLGDVLNKVGRTSGWTQGEVLATCINVLQSGSNRVILCQDLVGADSTGGDSGSPVFMQQGDSGNVTLYGVLWGGGPGVFVFSAMENVAFELGPFSLY